MAFSQREPPPAPSPPPYCFANTIKWDNSQRLDVTYHHHQRRQQPSFKPPSSSTPATRVTTPYIPGGKRRVSRTEQDFARLEGTPSFFPSKKKPRSRLHHSVDPEGCAAYYSDPNRGCEPVERQRGSGTSVKGTSYISSTTVGRSTRAAGEQVYRRPRRVIPETTSSPALVLSSSISAKTAAAEPTTQVIYVDQRPSSPKPAFVVIREFPTDEDRQRHYNTCLYEHSQQRNHHNEHNNRPNNRHDKHQRSNHQRDNNHQCDNNHNGKGNKSTETPRPPLPIPSSISPFRKSCATTGGGKTTVTHATHILPRINASKQPTAREGARIQVPALAGVSTGSGGSGAGTGYYAPSGLSGAVSADMERTASNLSSTDGRSVFSVGSGSSGTTMTTSSSVGSSRGVTPSPIPRTGHPSSQPQRQLPTQRQPELGLKFHSDDNYPLLADDQALNLVHHTMERAHHIADTMPDSSEAKCEAILRSIILPRSSVLGRKKTRPTRKKGAQRRDTVGHGGRCECEECEGADEGRDSKTEVEQEHDDEEELFNLDDSTLSSILAASNKLFFDGRLEGRVKWEWSHPSSGQYRDQIIGTTALRRKTASQNQKYRQQDIPRPYNGYETLIILSHPILRSGTYTRRLLISTFLHELIHCFLFVCCGFDARRDGGHTRGFREIAMLVDRWVGEGVLHLGEVEADLGRFRRGGSKANGGAGANLNGNVIRGIGGGQTAQNSVVSTGRRHTDDTLISTPSAAPSWKLPTTLPPTGHTQGDEEDDYPYPFYEEDAPTSTASRRLGVRNPHGGGDSVVNNGREAPVTATMWEDCVHDAWDGDGHDWTGPVLRSRVSAETWEVYGEWDY